MDILLDFLKETVFLCFYFSSSLIGLAFPLTGVKSNSSEKSSIVFVRGILTLNPIYFFLKRYLEKQGYPVYMTNFAIEAHDLNKNAQLLRDYMKEKCLKDVVLVGSSIGGVIGFHYVQKLGGWRKVKKLIVLGSPLKGSYLVSRFLFFLKAGKQMLPNSKYLEDLFSEGVKNIDKIVCISARYDEIVPDESSEIPGAKIERLRDAGHVNLLAFSNQAYRLIDKYASLN